MQYLDAINFNSRERMNLNDYVFKNEKLELEKHQAENTLANIKKINIFVGANNSGKSRILRKIFRQEKFGSIGALEKIQNIKKEIATLQKLPSYGLKDITDLVENISKENFWIISESENRTIHDSIGKLNINKNRIKNHLNKEEGNSLDEIIKNLTEIDSLNKYNEFDKIYIPVLRGLRQISGKEDLDLFKNRTIYDYFEERSQKTNYETLKDYGLKHEENWSKCIFTGNTIFTSIRKKLLGSKSDRKFIQDYQNWLKDNFFETENEVTLIPEEESGVIHVTLSSERPDTPIYEMGDGLQSIFIISYPIFEWAYKNKDNEKILLACIEEPELFLHPSMQNKIIQTLKKIEFEKIQFFITTHSNHFLDVIQDEENVSIFNVTNNQKNKIVTYTNDLSETVYEMLGAKPSSLLLANKTIWVEGVSDRIYIRKGIELFMKEFDDKKKISEDADFAFIEYGGSNLHHYMNNEEKDLDISKISNPRNIFLIADNDGTSDASAADTRIQTKHERYEDIKTQINDKGRFIKTEWKEIENYIKKDILEKIYNQNEESRKIIDLAEKDYKSTNKSLGSALLNVGITRYIDKNGNFSKKPEFAQKITSKQEKWSDLSPEMQNLIKEIHAFVSKD